jgi:hypothetical protein
MHPVARVTAQTFVAYGGFSDVTRGTWTEGVWERDAEENIWTADRRSDRRLVKTT